MNHKSKLITTASLILSILSIIIVPYELAAMLGFLALIVAIIYVMRIEEEIELFCMTPRNETGLSVAFYVPPMFLGIRTFMEYTKAGDFEVVNQAVVNQ